MMEGTRRKLLRLIPWCAVVLLVACESPSGTLGGTVGNGPGADGDAGIAVDAPPTPDAVAPDLAPGPADGVVDGSWPDQPDGAPMDAGSDMETDGAADWVLQDADTAAPDMPGDGWDGAPFDGGWDGGADLLPDPGYLDTDVTYVDSQADEITPIDVLVDEGSPVDWGSPDWDVLPDAGSGYQGDCCSSNGSAGCEDPVCTAIICADDGYCCSVTWDFICANSAEEDCGICGGGGDPDVGGDVGPDVGWDAAPDVGWDAAPDVFEDTGTDWVVDVEPDVGVDGGPSPYTGDCCVSNGSAGCEDAACTEEICAADAYCCNVQWDSICANDAQDSCKVCGGVGEPDTIVDGADDWVEDTGPGPASGDCCQSNGSAGCEIAACEDQVCVLDPYCCNTNWDGLCVACAQGGTAVGGGDCEGFHEICGCEPLWPPPPTALEIAEHWAPVWYQDTDDTNYAADFITAFDFDGDTESANNWESLDGAPDLSAVIYYAVVETETHFYITYADFHPRDWTEDCDPWIPFQEPCHENDMEGVMVMVEKDDSTFGSFVLLYTEAHDTLHIFTNDPFITPLSTPNLEKILVTFEGESHPELYVESKGHGVCALYYDGDDHCAHDTSEVPPLFPGGDGIVYRYKDGVAETPESGWDDDVGYALVPIETSFWPLRFDICDGCTFDTTMTYDGVTLGKAFDGDTWGDDKANPPWAWDDPDDGPVYRGDFFFRPAKTVKTHVSVPGVVSQSYVVNPFLDSL